MALQRFDELNNYFSVMEISDSAKSMRVRISQIIGDYLIDLFYLMALMDGEYAIREIKPKLMQKLQREVPLDTEMENHIDKMLHDTVDIANRHTDDEWYLSDDRAYQIAVDEANSIANYEDYQEAMLMGATHKTWLTMKDNRVRFTHDLVDNDTVAINENFIVGGYPMRFPHDPSAPAEEIINCRCAVAYS